jgi:hypothetical protein
VAAVRLERLHRVGAVHVESSGPKLETAWFHQPLSHMKWKNWYEYD